MSRENARAKGARYLAEHRLTVLRLDRTEVAAECRGDGAVHHLGWQDGTWRCDCPAKTTCSHLFALMAVCVREAV
jgi:hypothetical protein